MSKATPAALRLAAILKLFAEDPAKSWSLSEIVEELEISRSTCHALLIGLDSVDLVYRDKDKRYSLGGLAAAIGRAASRRGSIAEIVQGELGRLSQELGVISVTNYRCKDGILIRDWIDPFHDDGIDSWAGTTIPLAPPWGAIFFAWEPVAEQRRWLTASDSIARDALRLEHLKQGLSAIRQQSFMCGIHADHPIHETLDMAWRQRQMYTDHFATNIDPLHSYKLDFLAAPVFNHKNKIVFAVSLTGFFAKMNGKEIRLAADQLRASCRKIGSLLGDREYLFS